MPLSDLDGDGRIDLLEMFTVLKNVLVVDDDQFIASVATEIVMKAAEVRGRVCRTRT